MPLALRAQENSQNAQRLQSRLFRFPAALAFVNEDSPESELQGQSDGLRFSAAQILLQSLDPAAVTDCRGYDPTIGDRLMDRQHPRVLADRLELLNNSVGDEDLVECLAQKMELVNRGEIEEW